MQTTVLNSPSELQGMLNGIAADFAETDYGECLENELDLFAEMEKGFFDSSSGPDGQPWAANAPSTVRRKGHSIVLRGMRGTRPANIKATKRRPAVSFSTSKNTSEFRLAQSLTLKSHESFDDAIREAVSTQGGGALTFGSAVPYAGDTMAGRPTAYAPSGRPHIGMNTKHLDGIVGRVLDYTIKKLTH